MSLYRKYRPLDFSSLQGQDHIREILLGALKTGRVSHAYLFTGPRGTGKTSTARIMARAINCESLNEHGPCNTCDICLGALNESLTDFVEIDAASHGLVDDARALVEQARFMPTQAKKKIYIIDEVHMLSKSAFNALLKIIEEPPEHVHFILATTESHKVLETIKSRCQKFDFHLADVPLITQRLLEVCVSENASADQEALKLLAQHARGSFRDALSLLEQVIGAEKITLESVNDALGLSEHSSVENFLSALTNGEKAEALHLIHQIHDQGTDLYQFCQSVLEQLRFRLLQTPSQVLLSWVEIFFQALDQLKDSFIPELPLELAVLKCLGVSQASQNPQPVQAPPTPISGATTSSERKPRKIVEKSPEAVGVPVSEPAVVSEVVPGASSGSFDSQKFIALLSSVSLRSLLKHSQLDFVGNELTIIARYQFELEKIKEAAHQNQISEALNQMMEKKVSLKFAIAQQEAKKDLPSEAGLSNNELKTIFS